MMAKGASVIDFFFNICTFYDKNICICIGDMDVLRRFKRSISVVHFVYHNMFLPDCGVFSN